MLLACLYEMKDFIAYLINGMKFLLAHILYFLALYISEIYRFVKM